jgi:asparagine synthase (glutamine-hydrolysing)
MCGICGGIGPKAPNISLLTQQLKSIEHRGPDDHGTFLAPEISLGMCRLSIVEISSGQQPARDEHSQIHLVFNGEIYNYKLLRDELSGKGVKFQTSSEAEVIIRAFLYYGISFIAKLNGMFAIALFDARSNELFLIRDRMGKKPLWISEYTDGSILFASEVRALMIARSDRTLRSEMITEVMQYGYINSPNSAFHEISQVPPGNYLHWKNSGSQIIRYWTPTFHPKNEISYQDALEHTKTLIENAVKRRLISERPIGSFLSGGYDSTIVTAYMSKLSTEKVQTYSIGFNKESFNEAHHAKRISEYLGTSHHEEILSPDPSLVVETISKVLDQPFADSSIIPTYLLSKFARNDLVVALSGDGGDEIFGGYDRYLAAPLLQRFNHLLKPLRAGLLLTGNLPVGNNRKLKRASSQLEPKSSLAARYLSIQSLTQRRDLLNLLNPEIYSSTPEEEFISNFDVLKELKNLDRLIQSDLSYYLPGDILTKIDIASMANSLELRSPLLDVEVVEWGLTLPDDFRIKGFETKHILKDVARSLVPAELIDRPKMGFGIPRAEWLRTEMKQMVMDLLTDRTFKERMWFNDYEVDLVLNRHMKGQDLDNQIWPILMLELWARTWLD